jgi:AcrR family transcriptional regulator
MTISRNKAPTRRQPQQRRSQQTVEAVLDAVAKLIKREGVTSVTTNRIAETAGVSIGSVYQYFPDKRAIYMALHKRHLDAVDELVKTTLVETAKGSLEQAMRALIEALIEAHNPDSEMYEVMFSEIPHRADGTLDFSVRLHGIFRLAIASRSHEIVGARDLDKVVFVVSHMVESLSHGAVLRRPKGISLTDAKDEIVRAVMAYLRM